MQNNFPYLDTWPHCPSKLCSVIVLLVWITTIKFIFDQVLFQARKSFPLSEESQFLGLKLFHFPLLNHDETFSDINSSLKPLASQEIGRFYRVWDLYRPVQISSIKLFKISGTIDFFDNTFVRNGIEIA